MGSPLNPPFGDVERADALGRVYAMLAKLLVTGLDADLLARLRSLDGWLLDGSPTLDLDELAAQHHACFHLDSFPYAGVFLDPSATAGACSDLVLGYFVRDGFRPRLDQLAADHLGVTLGFLAFVCAATGEALADGEPNTAAQLERVTAQFLDACILAWLPALVAANADARAGFWPNVLRETLDVCAVHRNTLRERAPELRAPKLPEAPEHLLDDPHTDLRRIAEHLLAPTLCGALIRRSDIAGLGRTHALPRGFGSRLVMLDNLLRTAVDHGALAVLLADLDSLLAARDQALNDLAAELDLAAPVAPWRRALARTRALVSNIAAAT